MCILFFLFWIKKTDMPTPDNTTIRIVSEYGYGLYLKAMFKILILWPLYNEVLLIFTNIEKLWEDKSNWIYIGVYGKVEGSVVFQNIKLLS